MTHHNNEKEHEENTGAEGNASADVPAPFVPRKDDKTPLGDTDQHSKAGADKKVPAEKNPNNS